MAPFNASIEYIPLFIVFLRAEIIVLQLYCLQKSVRLLSCDLPGSWFHSSRDDIWILLSYSRFEKDFFFLQNPKRYKTLKVRLVGDKLIKESWTQEMSVWRFLYFYCYYIVPTANISRAMPLHNRFSEASLFIKCAGRLWSFQHSCNWYWSLLARI